MNIIETLKNEHLKIIALFDQIDKTTDLNIIKELVKQLASVTTDHLKKEDTLLYPALSESKNIETKQTGLAFSSTMPDYVTDFTKVVTNILNIQTINPEILTQYQKIRDKIKNRITSEETILFPSFEL